MSFVDDLTGTPVLIVAGTGGVGKTTMSCALAISLAQRNDARVLVITIDPAKRLAAILCEENLGHEPQKVDHSRFVKESARGEVFAAMIDTQSGWREIVERYAKSTNDAQRIFDNKLYANLTTRFSHSHDFVAMDQLYEHYRSGSFDYIVLDTPPTSQAFGFFDAPQAMSEFFGGRMVRMITSPYRMGKGRAAKLFDIASQPFFALADKVLGKQFLNDIGEFFFLFHTMYDDFVNRATTITDFLTSSRVHAALVTSPSQYVSHSYQNMCEGLSDRKINLSHIIVNNVPFAPHVETEIAHIVDEHNEQTETVIESFLRRDWELSVSVYDELDRGNQANRDHSGAADVHLVAVSRIMALDELTRISDLVESVQNTSDFDDTI